MVRIEALHTSFINKNYKETCQRVAADTMLDTIVYKLKLCTFGLRACACCSMNVFCSKNHIKYIQIHAFMGFTKGLNVVYNKF